MRKKALKKATYHTLPIKSYQDMKELSAIWPEVEPLVMKMLSICSVDIAEEMLDCVFGVATQLGYVPQERSKC